MHLVHLMHLFKSLKLKAYNTHPTISYTHHRVGCSNNSGEQQQQQQWDISCDNYADPYVT
jgi:hypothetical protein